MDIIYIIGIVAAFIAISKLSSRVTQLERQLRDKLVGVAQAASPNMVPQPPTTGANIATPIIPIPVAPIQPSAGEQFFAWLKEDWLLKLGVGLLLIGFGWLTTYAFLNNWIGPAGRIMLGLVTGMFFIVFGWWRMRRYVHQGGIFLVLGSTTVLLTVFAARELYGFFTPATALLVMFLSSAFVAIASVQFKSGSLALTSLVLAGVAPLLTSSPSYDYVGLFLYLLAVIIGSLWVVALTGKRELTTAGLILISFYSLPHIFSMTSADPMTLLPFAFAFSALFFITNTIGIVRSSGGKIVADLVTAAGNGLFLLAWIMSAAPNEIQSLLIAAWMVVFAIGAFGIFIYTGRREPFYVYAGVSVALLAAATSAELQGATLVIAFTLEACIIPMITYALTKDVKVASRTSWLLAAPVILSLNSLMSNEWYTSILHKDFFVLLVLALALFELGLFLLPRNREAGDEQSRQTNYLLLILGSFYAYALLWLSLGAGLENDNTAVMISLAVYTIIGLITYFYGIAHEKRGLLLYGGALIGFVVVRLLLVDVWRMALAGRIATFLLIGTLLVASAFFGKKKKDAPIIVN